MTLKSQMFVQMYPIFSKVQNKLTLKFTPRFSPPPKEHTDCVVLDKRSNSSTILYRISGV